MFRRRSGGRRGLAGGLLLGGAVLAGAAAAVLLRRKRKGAAMADAKEIVRRALEEPWVRGLDVLDELVSADYIGYDPSQPQPIRGPEGLKANLKQYIDAFSGARITVDDQIAEGDKVATRWTGRGTHTGEIAGIAATGKDVTVTGLTMSRLQGGKIVEEWTTWDTLGMLVQLGAVPAPAQA
ncbi:MAG TPA: ester cyclase [Gaiellaceae bacterium]|nr:ester cyclase [Gaiellaceae bacterium]